MFMRKNKIVFEQNAVINALLHATDSGVEVTFHRGSNQDIFHKVIDMRLSKDGYITCNTWNTYSDEGGLAETIIESTRNLLNLTN